MAIRKSGEVWTVYIGGKVYRGDLRTCYELARLEQKVRHELPLTPHQRYTLEHPYKARG